MNQIRQMFELQKQLNEDINGTQWTDGITQEGRHISWHRCIYMEAAEAINSFNWKHWKNINGDNDWENARVELVDIWHFIMSEGIYIGDTKYAEIFLDTQPEKELDADKIVETLEKLLAASAQSAVDKSNNAFHQVTRLFFTALANIGMDVAELYKRYLVKNQLNIFRQNHGYKEGTYNKIWDAVEDNVIAFHIMEEQPNLAPEQLYKKLEEEYKKNIS